MREDDMRLRRDEGGKENERKIEGGWKEDD